MAALDETFNELEQRGFEFLMTDLNTALTFCSIARDAGEDLEKKNRTQQNARHAYDTVLRLAAKFRFTEDESGKLKDKLRELRNALEDLGEVF